MYKITLFFLFISVFSFAQDSIKLKIYRENVGKNYYIYVDNEELAPVSIEYTYTSENMSSSLPDKSVVVIPSNKKKFELTELKSIDQNNKTKFSYNVYYVLGDVNARITNQDFIYTLPFEKNKTHSIYQGYNGSFSHQNALSLDFSLQTGDKVLAARGGKVITVITKNTKNCLTKDCAKFNNQIIIMHDDGTLAEYVHLKNQDSPVKVGDTVEPGQLIGYSGNTGWSKGPHLHFSLYVNNIDGTRTYFKTKFRTSESKATLLETGKKYKN